jgi:DNA-binding PadR family transcriptional regulator
MLRLAALRMFSTSSMSGVDFAEEVSRVTKGVWKPGPGSVYLILKELSKKGLITELPKREGNMRRYIISGKGKEELEKLAKTTDADVVKQLKLLAVYSSLAGREGLERKLSSLAKDVAG